jgi:hypothetical protein
MAGLTPQYLAGFFDGEGTISVQWNRKKGTDKKYPHSTVLLSQSGEDGYNLLKEIQDQYGGKIYLHLRKGEYKATKNAWKLYWNKTEAIKMLQQIQPYLILKQQNAIVALEYLQR